MTEKWYVYKSNRDDDGWRRRRIEATSPDRTMSGNEQRPGGEDRGEQRRCSDVPGSGSICCVLRFGHKGGHDHGHSRWTR